jgi:hypothetical protein
MRGNMLNKKLLKFPLISFFLKYNRLNLEF